MKKLSFEYGDKTVQELVLLFKDNKLNLEPGFQRKSVWSISDRKKLIESVFQKYPVPSVFLYKRYEDGQLKYDVIDGKQRLESILMFQGLGRFKSSRFPVRTSVVGEEIEEWNWQKVQRKHQEHRVMEYKIQTVEVSGELSDIINLFVRINSTGKRLTGAEKRHARFYQSAFLKLAGRLADQKRSFFVDNRVLSKGQISRMKHVELVCELLASQLSGGPINKKTALDNVIGGQLVDARSLNRSRAEFTRTINLVKKMFPGLRATRFANSVDFYSLFLLIWKFDKEGQILSTAARNRQAQKLLEWLTSGVAKVRDQVRRAEGAKPDQELFRNYLLTVQGDTDSLANRKRRAEILENLLGGLFEIKDAQRNFTIEQRWLIWHSDQAKRCTGCKEKLDWTNFTIDHIKSHSRGGRSTVSNAKIMCRSCNSRKGNR